MAASIDPALRIRGVHLAVSDLARSVEFYERLLGVPLLQLSDGTALLGWDAHAPALTLQALAQPVPLPVRATGLYHVAWLHDSRAALADTVRRLAHGGWQLEGASDHGVSEALYLSDPDGLGIEIYADRPHELWQHGPQGRGVSMVTLPLDLEDLLAQSPGPAPERMPAGTRVGHVHLKVADVERTSAFYRDRIGLEEQAHLPYASFLSAGGYHHHIGLNSWQSARAGAPPANAPALRRIELALSSPDELEALGTQLGEGEQERERDGELLARDPDGELLAFLAA